MFELRVITENLYNSQWRNVLSVRFEICGETGSDVCVYSQYAITLAFTKSEICNRGMSSLTLPFIIYSSM